MYFLIFRKSKNQTKMSTSSVTYILNPKTLKEIEYKGPLYHELIEEGYQNLDGILRKMDQELIVNISMIQINDRAYILSIFKYLVERISTQIDFESEPKYYYQYQYDGNMNLYEQLMYCQQITIQARSLEESNILNSALMYFIADNYCDIDALIMFILEKKKHMRIKNDTITFDDLLYEILYSSELSMFKDYVSDTVKDPTVRNIEEYDVVLTYEEIKAVRIFNIENIKRILDLFEQYPEKFDSKIVGKKKAILNVLEESSFNPFVKSARRA